jgi:hypothetical protein
MSLPVHFRAARALVAVAGLVFLSACELGLQAYQQSSSGGCENWQAGCPIDIDVKSDGPILTTRSDVQRAEIVDAAATTEVRACPDWPNTCPVQIMGDVIEEQYFFVF